MERHLTASTGQRKHKSLIGNVVVFFQRMSLGRFLLNLQAESSGIVLENNRVIRGFEYKSQFGTEVI